MKNTITNMTTLKWYTEKVAPKCVSSAPNMENFGKHPHLI